MVAVTVGDRDAPDRRAGVLGSSEHRVAAVRDHRVHQREAVVLTHEVRIHEPQPCELDEVPGELTYAHGRP